MGYSATLVVWVYPLIEALFSWFLLQENTGHEFRVECHVGLVSVFICFYLSIFLTFLPTKKNQKCRTRVWVIVPRLRHGDRRVYTLMVRRILEVSRVTHMLALCRADGWVKFNEYMCYVSRMNQSAALRIHTYTHTHKHIQSHTCTYIRAHTRAHTSTYTHMHTHTDRRVHTPWLSSYDGLHMCIIHIHVTWLTKCDWVGTP